MRLAKPELELQLAHALPIDKKMRHEWAVGLGEALSFEAKLGIDNEQFSISLAVQRQSIINLSQHFTPVRDCKSVESECNWTVSVLAHLFTALSSWSTLEHHGMRTGL
jgi:hypothetical protein